MPEPTIEDSSILTPDQQKMAIYAGTKGASVVAGYPLSAVRAGQWVKSSKNLSFSASFSNICRNKGPIGLYDGVLATALGMSAKEGYRGLGFEKLGHGWQSAAFNALADTIVSMPLDKAKTLQQTSKVPTSFIKSLRIIHSGGFLKESYKGAPFYFGRQLGAHGCTVGFQALSEHVVNNIIYEDQQQASPAAGIAGSVVAGIAVATVTNPLHKIFTQMQAKIGSEKQVPDVFKKIVQQEGVFGLLKGSSVGYAFAIIGQLCYYQSKKWCAQIDEERAHSQELTIN